MNVLKSGYEYDKLGRLTEEVNNGVLYNYTYDENGNIKTKKKTANSVQIIDTFNYSEYSYVVTNSPDDKIYGKTNILQESLNITNDTSYDQYKLKIYKNVNFT